MKRPSAKSIEVIREVLVESLKRDAILTKTEGPLTSIFFPSDTKIPNNMYDMREELKERGFMLFYSTIIYKDKEVLSINLTKI